MYRDDAEARRLLRDARTRCRVGDEPCPPARSPRSVAGRVYRLALWSMLVGCLVVLVTSLTIPRRGGCLCDRPEIARSQVEEIAVAWYGRWSREVGEDRRCPRDLVEVAQADPLWDHATGHGPQAARDDIESTLRDPWGEPFRMRCSTTPGYEFPFGVASAGEDRLFGTADDILSWEPRRP